MSPSTYHLTVPAQSMPDLHSESNSSKLSVARQPSARPLSVMSSASGLALTRTTLTRSPATAAVRRVKGKASRVFRGIRKALGGKVDTTTSTRRISKPQPARRSGGAGYVFPGDLQALPAKARREPNQARGRGNVAANVGDTAGDTTAGKAKAKAKPSRRSYYSSSFSTVARVASRHLSSHPESLLPGVVVSRPVSASARSVLLASSTGSRPITAGSRPLEPARWSAYSNLYVTNPGSRDGASSTTTTTIVTTITTVESAADQDVEMSGALGDLPPVSPFAVSFGELHDGPEDYEEFKAKYFASVTPKPAPRPSVPVSKSPPTLQYIPVLAPLDLSGESAFELNKSLPPTPTSADRVQRNRDAALATLEGESKSTSSTTPHAIPASLRPQPHPMSLLPGPQFTDHEGVQRMRPMTYQERPRSEHKWYSPDDLEVLNPMFKYLQSAKAKSKAKAPQTAGYAGEVGDDGEKKYPIRSWAPVALAYPNKEHKSLYARVESGNFDDVVVPAAPPATPSIPPSLAIGDRNSGTSIGRTFLDAPTPPSSCVASQVAALEALAPTPVPAPAPAPALKPILKAGARKPVPAPTTPVTPVRASVRPTSIPAPHKMNSNGYPIANLSAASAQYTASPAYQPRTIDEVEAKYRSSATYQRSAAIANTSATHQRTPAEQARYEADFKRDPARAVLNGDKVAVREAAKLQKSDRKAEVKAEKAAAKALKEKVKAEKKEQKKVDAGQKQKQMERAVKKVLGG